MAQYALPTSDISKTDWSQLAGDNDGDAFDELDEGFGAGRGSGAGPDDATTVWQTATVTSVTRTIECGLGSVTDPNSSTSHVIRARIAKSSDSGAPVACVLSLYQGTTLIASSADSGDLAAAYSTLEYTLSAGEANAITDYADLRLRAVFTIGAGTARRARISALELEVPDAGGGSVELTVADMSVTMASEEPSLTQHNTLVAQDVSLALAEEAPALTQHNVLVAQDMWHNLTMDGPVMGEVARQKRVSSPWFWRH